MEKITDVTEALFWKKKVNLQNRNQGQAKWGLEIG